MMEHKQWKAIRVMEGGEIITSLISKIVEVSTRIAKETGLEKAEVEGTIIRNLKFDMDRCPFLDENGRTYYAPEALEGDTEVARWINSHVIRYGNTFPMDDKGVEIKEGDNFLKITPHHEKNQYGGWTTTATAEYVYKGVKGTAILDEDDDCFWVRKP
jgi:hypothetical protein